jgi:uncharacterized repeat protein (TIGR02543 family)
VRAVKAATLSLLLALAMGLLLGGGEALARSTALPPGIIVEVVGGGKVTGTGINCGMGVLNCAATYSDATPQALTATAASGWTFEKWDDGCSASAAAPTCAAATPAAGGATVTAIFTRAPGLALSYQTFSVSLSSNLGEVFNNANTLNNDNITCGDTDNDPADGDADGDGATAGGLEGAACSVSLPQTSTITVRQQADDGYFFNGWGGSCSGTGSTCSAYLNADRVVSAEFLSSETNTLTVKVDGSGTVTGGGINCGSGSTCTKQEPPTVSVTLNATPASGYAFTGWTGGCSGLQTTCTVQMSSNQDVTANFDPLVPVNITVNGAGTVSGANVTCGPGPQTCSGTAAPNSRIQLQATPAAAGGTVTWTGCSSATGTTCNLSVLSSPVNVTATFSGGSSGGGSFVTLSVGVSGDGYVTSSGATNIWCTAAGGAGCTATVQQGSVVVLSAVPASGSSNDFDGWDGGCSGFLMSCTVTVSAAKTVNATFEPADNTTYNLTASVTGTGTVSGAGLNCRGPGVGCTSPQAADAKVTINATPGPGQAFAGWSGACTGTNPSCQVAMSSDQKVTAAFRVSGPSTVSLTLSAHGAGRIDLGTAKCVSTAAKPATCAESVEAGSPVELKAVPAKGYVFAGWKGACAGTKPTCTLNLTADAKVSATFAVLAPGAKAPTVKKLATGYRVTITFRTGEAGSLTVTSKPKSTTVRKTVKAGAGSVLLTLHQRGSYVVTLSLKSKSGTHTLRYTVKV